MATVRAKVKPELLEWGRTSAGFSVEEAAKKVPVKPERLEAWEKIGNERPTINQLRKLAKAYKRPLSLFYLSKRPKDFEPMHDFRRLPGEVAQMHSPTLRMEIRAAYQRRELALDLLEEIDEEPPRFSWPASINENPEEIGQKIREVLHVRYGEQVQWRRERDAYNMWRRKIESVGVLVFQAAGLLTKEMRGFSIAEEILPVIVVNIKDGLHGRTFSLLHEFAHLMLRESALCDFDEESTRLNEEQRVEVYCNHVAGAALVPRDRLLAENLVARKGEQQTTWDNDELYTLSRQYGVSREVVLRRLLTLGRTTQKFYREKRQEFLAIYRILEEQGKMGEFRRNLPREAVSNYGRTFARLVLNTYYQDRITLSDVTKYLGIRAKHLSRVEEMIGAQ